MCAKRETVVHAFCECLISTDVWRWVFLLINKLYSTPIVFSSRLVLFRHGLPRGKQFHKPNALASVIIKITLNEWWAARNRATFEGKLVSAENVLRAIEGRLRFRVKAASNLSDRQAFIQA